MYPFHYLRMRPHDDTRARLIMPEEKETAESRKRIEAWLRGYISFTDLCALMGWDAAERRATLEGLGVQLPEWLPRTPPPAWTKQQPTEEGYYWLHDKPEGAYKPRTYLVYFKDAENVRVHGGAWLPARLTDGPETLWAGPVRPLMLPEEGKGCQHTCAICGEPASCNAPERCTAPFSKVLCQQCGERQAPSGPPCGPECEEEGHQ